MRPIRDINYRFNGKITDFTNQFKDGVDEIIRFLNSAKRLADRDCPYDAEYWMYAAQLSFRGAVEIVRKCADNYERTADALRCDAKPEEVKEKQEPADQNQYKDIELGKRMRGDSQETVADGLDRHEICTAGYDGNGDCGFVMQAYLPKSKQEPKDPMKCRNRIGIWCNSPKVREQPQRILYGGSPLVCPFKDGNECKEYETGEKKK